SRSRCSSRLVIPSSGSNRITSSRSAIAASMPPALRRCNAVPTPAPMKTALLIAATLAVMAAPASAQQIDRAISPGVKARIDRILKATPLIDGHNDIAEQLAENYHRHIDGLASGTDQRQPHPLMTDMARLHAGRVG